MEIRQETLKMSGALPKAENPQPELRSKKHDVKLFHDGSLQKEELVRYGTGCAARVLPYRMQDRYTRAEEPLEIETFVLENEFLRATFLPGYGGRLWSLYAKDEKRELLFVNPVFRPANLANRNAWLAGGIEWNLGHTGHCAFTCDDLFCTVVKAPDGERFLRMYEYEATHAQVLQMDFHLPDGARQLGLHLRVTNARQVPSPLYWWTNTALRLKPETRVFAATGDILYQLTPNPEDKTPGFGRCKMPLQPNLACEDVSYPWQIPHSVEYFFQTPAACKAPWELSAEGDGQGFLERSTQPLFARKMFCWGMGSGGRHWCDFLAKDGQGDYIEIQAGLAPTQHHTALLQAGETLCFTQLFGAFNGDGKALQQSDWAMAQKAAEAAAEKTLSEAQTLALHKEYAGKALLAGQSPCHTASMYGFLEDARRKKAGQPPLAQHLAFPPCGRDAAAWAGVLEGRPLPCGQVPLAYMVDPLWEPYLQELSGQSTESAFQYAVLLAENGREAEAEALLSPLAKEGNAYAAYTLGSLFLRAGEKQKAAEMLEKALGLAGDRADPSFWEGYLQALLQLEDYTGAFAVFGRMPNPSDTARLLACEAALQLEEFAFLEDAFMREYATIREGALGLADIWFEYQARKAAKEKGLPFTEGQIDRSLPLPRHLDFRMFE